MSDIDNEILDLLHAKLIEAIYNAKIEGLSIDKLINAYINLVRLQNDLQSQGDDTTILIKYVQEQLPNEAKEQLGI
jgi:hypothetical protein